jgi:hypothetical protein
MALKPDRRVNPYAEEISFFMNEAAEKGGFVVMSTVGSGQAMDQSAALVTYAANPSGKLPVGVLLQDMVNKDLTQTHLNPYNGEVQIGGKVNLCDDCVVNTNMIYPGLTIAVNDNAYAGPSGLFQNVDVNPNATPILGTFLSSKDADGYAKVRFKTPMATPRL